MHRGFPTYWGRTEAPSGWTQRTEVSQDTARLLELHKHISSRGKNRCTRIYQKWMQRVGRFSPSTSLAHPCSLRGDTEPVTEGTLCQNCSCRNTPVLNDKAQTTSSKKAGSRLFILIRVLQKG